MGPQDLAAPELREGVQQRLQELREGFARFEWRHVTKNGGVLEVEIAARPIQRDGKTCILSSVRDITERKRSEAEVRRLSRLLVTLSQVNYTIVHVRERSQLFSALCRVAVEHGGFRMAWIGLLEEATGAVRPVAQAGYDEGYVPSLNITVGKEPAGRGPTGCAVRDGRLAVCDDIETDPRMEPWRDAALRRDYRASAAIPIRSHGRVIGAFSLYSEESGFFGASERQLLEDIGGSIAYALDALESESERKQAEEALRRSEENLRLFVENAPVAIAMFDRDMRYLAASRRWMSDYRLGDASLYGRSHYEVFPEIPERWKAAHRRGLAGEVVRNDEDRYDRADGTVQWGRWELRPWRASDGSVGGIIIFSEDITERKHREKEYRELIDGMNDTAFVIDFDGHFLEVNETAVRMLGYSRQELLSLGPVDIDPHLEPREIRRLIEGMKTDERQVFETEHRTKKGLIIPVEISSSRVTYQDKPAVLSIARDITWRKQAEAAIQETQRRLTTLISNLPGLVYRCRNDEDWTMEFISEGILALSGYAPADFVEQRRHFAQLIHPDDRERVWGEVQDALAQRRPYELTYRLVTAAGAEKWVTDHGCGVFDASGALLILEGFVADISRRRRAEEALRQKTEESDRFFALALDLLCIADTDGFFRRLNPEWKAVLGYDIEFLEGKRFLDLVHPDDLAATHAAIAELSAGQTVRAFVNRYRRRDGSFRWIEWRATPYGDRLIYAAARDVTERRDREENLRQTNERFLLATRAARLGVWDWDISKDELVWDDRMYDLYGVNKDSFRGGYQAWIDCVHPDDAVRLNAEIQRAQQGEKELDTEFRVIWLDGTIRHLKAYGKVAREADGKPSRLTGINYDTTEQRTMEGQLRQSQKMDAVGQLAGGVAHDFNNILQAMMGYAQMLLNAASAKGEQREELEEILKGAQRAAALTRQLLLFSRREVMAPETLDLNQVVENLLKMLRRVIGEHIRLEWAPGKPLGFIHADAGMMEQALMNLCVNARDAMPNGGVLTIETQNALIEADYCASRPWAKPGRYVLLSVADTGCGMDRTTRERVFEPFFTTKAEGKGTGLGLATVYGIVKQHGGMIDVYSEPGKGAVFKVYLPVTVRKARSAGPKNESPTRGGSETILLAEDDEGVRKLAKRVLERAGYSVLAVKDGEEAVTRFKEDPERVALLLLDVVMPRLGGYDALKRIRAIRPDVPALFTSGYIDDAVRTSFELLEGRRLVQKPYVPDALLRAVRAVLDAHTGPGGDRNAPSAP